VPDAGPGVDPPVRSGVCAVSQATKPARELSGRPPWSLADSGRRRRERDWPLVPAARLPAARLRWLREARAGIAEPGAAPGPPLHASAHVLAVPADVGAGAAAVGHQPADREADTAHPAGLNGGPRCGVDHTLVTSHDQPPRGSVGPEPGQPADGRTTPHRRLGPGSRLGSVPRQRPAIQAGPPVGNPASLAGYPQPTDWMWP
jgi:hypothetical protein